MSLVTALSNHFSLMLLISALLVSGCSSGSNTSNAGAQSPDNVSGTNENDVTSNESTHGNTNEMTIANPVGDDLAQPVQASLEIVPDKTFRISWQASTGAQFYRVLENADGISGFADISGELDASTTHFDHRVALFARVNAQYLVQSCGDQGCADSDALMVTGTLDNAIGYFKSSNTEIENGFGRSVSLSADGHTLAVSVGSADYAGAVYVFVRGSGQWQQQAYLKASNADASDYFGRSVSLSADGHTLAVSATNEASAATGIDGDQSDNSAEMAGAVYIFARSGGQWQQQAYLKASNTESNDFFGSMLSLSADGHTLAVSAPDEASATTGINGDQNDNSAYKAGAVYVFVRSAGQWQQQAYLKASNTDPVDYFGGSRFGRALSMSSDGNTLAVGASSADSANAVNVFVRSDGQWQQQANLKSGNADASDDFGVSVSLSADGNTLAVGASNDASAATGINGDQSDRSAHYSGAAYVFVQSGGQWQQQAYLKASNTDIGDTFGRSLSLSADGHTLAVSAYEEDSAATGIHGDQSDNSSRDSGAVYVYVQSGGQWQQRAYVKASNTGIDDNFGRALSLSANGNTLAVGASRERSAATGFNGDQSDDSVRDGGAVYLF